MRRRFRNPLEPIGTAVVALFVTGIIAGAVIGLPLVLP